MLHEKKIQTIFDEHFPQQILPSPVASRIKQQMQLQLSQQVRPSTVQNPAEQRKKINLLLVIEQWWDAFRPQLQPMPAFALTGATAVCLFLGYFLVQSNLLGGLAFLQQTDNTGSITAVSPNDGSANQTDINREPEVVVSYPTIDDMQIADDLGTVHAVAIAPTATPMPIMPTPLPQTSPEQMILRPTARLVDAKAVLPAAMDHPPNNDTTSSPSPTAQEALIDLPTPTSISIAIAPIQPTEPLPTVSQIVPTPSLVKSPIAVAIGNVQPISVAQMPTPNPNLSQTDIVLKPTPTYMPTATSISQSVAQVANPTETPVTTVEEYVGVLGEGPSVPPGLAAYNTTATAQAYNALSVINAVPTLLPPSDIVALPASPILPTATQIPPAQVSDVPIDSVETPLAVAVEITPQPSPTVLPTFTLVPAVPTETPVWISPTPRAPDPTNTAIPTVQPNNDHGDNDHGDNDHGDNDHSNNNDSKKKDEDKKRDENRATRPAPQPTATPIPPVVNVPVVPTAPPPPPPTSPPPPPPPPTSLPPTPVPEPVEPPAAIALPPTATSPPPPTPVLPTEIPPTQPPTQPPPTAKPVLPVHTATSEPTKRLPTATPIRVEIKPVVGVAEPTPRPTAIVQQPTAISEPVRESGLGAEPVTGKDSNPVKPVFTPTSVPDRTRPTPIRVEINPQPSAPKIIPTLTPRPTSKPIVLDSDAESDRLLGKDEGAELDSAVE